MQIISTTDDSARSQTVSLPDGSFFTFTMYYVPLQLGWFIKDLVYGAFTLNGLRITNNPNMLHQFVNQIPFGLGCISISDREPTLQQDFASGSSTLYLLSAEETDQYRDILNGTITV